MEVVHKELVKAFEEFEADLEVNAILDEVKKWSIDDEDIREFGEALLEERRKRRQLAQAAQAARHTYVQERWNPGCYPQLKPSGTSGALTSVATTGGMSLSAQPPLRQHRPPRPRSPVSEGLRRSNRQRTTYRPNNDDDDSDPDDDDSDPDDVDDKKDEDYDPDDDLNDSDPDEDLNDYVSDPDDNDLNDSEPDEDLNDYVPDPDDDETTELLTKDEQRRRRNAIKKARYNARYPEKARARNIRKKANYRHKYPEKVRAARKRYVEKYLDRVQESRRRYEETHKEERRAAKKQWARNNRARCTESDRKYKEKHRERIRLRDREYREKNRERILASRRMYNRSEKGGAARRAYYAANREKVLAQGREYYWENREKILEKSKRYYNKRKKDVPRPKPSLETYLNDFCASLPSVEPSVERQKTEEKIKALGPLKLTISLEDFIKSIPKTFENLSFCESFLEDYTLTDMDSGDVQVMDPSDLEDVSSLLQDVSPDEWTELLRDVEDSCSFDLEALVPPEDFVHDMSPDEGVDLMYDLVT